MGTPGGNANFHSRNSQFSRRCCADAAGRTRNQRNLTVDVRHSSSPLPRIPVFAAINPLGMIAHLSLG
jgi:hypothetical protein